MNRLLLGERFWEKVRENPDSGCWEWSAGKRGRGYAAFKVHGKDLYGHRLAYEELIGEIPAGLDIDHLCRVRHCVNPWHMEPVTRRENTLRGVGWCAQQSKKMFCGQGHPFDQENTYYDSKGRRSCRACGAAAARRYKATREAR